MIPTCSSTAASRLESPAPPTPPSATSGGRPSCRAATPRGCPGSPGAGGRPRPRDGPPVPAGFGDVPTSVSVVTTVDAAGAPHGMPVGSLCGLSLEPPLLLFCVAHSAGSHARLCAAERYCISVLAQGQ